MTTRLFESGILVFYFLRTRLMRFRSREGLHAWQQRCLSRFLRRRLPQLPYYHAHAGSSLHQLPVIDKQIMLENFDALNNVGITLEEASCAALAGETSRDFTPRLRGITVGFSSGTQGPRGVFMVSRREQIKWAAIMLARVLTWKMIQQIFLGRRPLKVAFFMRANSNLYTTLASRRIDFCFYDLFSGLDQHIPALQAHAPDILVAPSRILGEIAALVLEEKLQLEPVKVIAVAEVLEPDDRQRIEQAFGSVVHQLYQCTEGFLAYTCEHGVLHLNEEFIHVEPEWLDAERTRFVPIITDFTRSTQHIIRYRLNDILRVRDQPCVCGNAALALAAIDGRCDDILWLPDPQHGQWRPLYPDSIRHAISIAPGALPDYRIEQREDEFHIAVADDARTSFEGIAQALRLAACRHGLAEPACHLSSFIETAAQFKRRRIICRIRPSGMASRDFPSDSEVTEYA
jgi:putative adenylate-forming enzyme